MNEVLSNYLDIFCIAYLDDILIYSDSMEEHRKHVCIVLRWLRDVGLILKPSKCEFHMERMEYLGYIIAPTGLQMDPKKIKTVKEWQEPVNIKGIQSFLGFTNFYRWFIHDFSKITIPLTRLTKKQVLWEWNDMTQ
jgi:hypothetical protein